jgi:hypothetical protein
MYGNTTLRLAGLAAAGSLLLALSVGASAQGRGGGAGRGGGMGGGRASGGGPPAGVGVDRGIGNASERSGGRSDEGLGRASERSGGRSDAGLERARRQRENAHDAERELREHPEMAGRLHLNANDLREGYQAALASNPDLTFGQYVAATRLAANLGGRYPGVTREAILTGLASGDSLGDTLKELGVGSREAKDARRRVEREIKESRRRSS